jgi:predicted DNA-binding WGR domain protein
VPTDLAVKNEKQYKVYFDNDGRPWDAYLAKVDLKNGLYGDYVFYKIQLLHDTNRDLYVVLTRYGRIGEEGMNQRSPFPDVADAKKEFATIFKQKSSNEWETALTNFVKQAKKYNLVHVHYSNIKH